METVSPPPPRPRPRRCRSDSRRVLGRSTAGRAIGAALASAQRAAAAAAKILRQIVGLPWAPDIDRDRGDVTGDGDVGVGDVVDILRNLVGLQVPASSRVDKPPLESCS